MDGLKPIESSSRIERNQSVGIIGAGPAGLAAAEQLRQAWISSYNL